ncbi:trans-sialidase, putative, partial [Trypanosoma cruzi marinkellei]
MQARWCSLLHHTHRCRPAWLHGRSTVTVCFFIALSGRRLSLPVCVCVFYGSNESVCAGRPTLLFFIVSLVLWLSAP